MIMRIEFFAQGEKFGANEMTPGTRFAAIDCTESCAGESIIKGGTSCRSV